MATTGFWPIKGSLKKVVEYANNPDKTIDHKYLDQGLAQAIQYAGNDEKTDQKMYVSGINCTKNHAYEDMLAVQKRFGLRGANVAYHGYQSFRAGEVAPEQAHEIGKETARRMWGDRYQVLVTTHLNTDSVHNHMVVNAVSFIDGKKFQNYIRDHQELRKISDRVCLENRLTVLDDAPFYNSEKKEYWIHKKGQKTHRDILKEDIEECIGLSVTGKQFLEHLYERGYEYDYRRHSIKAPSWERGVRLDRLGYDREELNDRIYRNYTTKPCYKDYREYPLLRLEKQWGFEIAHSHDITTITLDVVFLIILELAKLVIGTPASGEYTPQPLSPEIRQACARLDELTAQVTLLCKYKIHTQSELETFIEEKTEQVSSLEKERQQLWNRLKAAKSPDRAAEIKATAKDITERLKPLRNELKTAKRALESAAQYRELISLEHTMEKYYLDNEKLHAITERKRER
jgi:hypothetical protein